MRVKFGIPSEGFGTYGSPDSVEVLEWHVVVGDRVSTDDPLVTIASEKIDTQIDAPVAGRVVQINYDANETWYSAGEEDTPYGRILLPELGIIDTDANDAAEISSEPRPKETPQEKPKEHVSPTRPEPRPTRIHVSPVAQRMLREHEIDLDDVVAWLRPPKDRVNKEDVEAFIRHREAGSLSEKPDVIRAVPAARQKAREAKIDISAIQGSGEYDTITVSDVEKILDAKREAPAEKPVSPDVYHGIAVRRFALSRRREAIAKNMQEAWRMPIAGGSVDVDPASLLQLREKLKGPFERDYGVKLRLEYFIVKACAHLLASEFPILNSCWQEEQRTVLLYQDVNVGITVAMPPEITESGISELAIPVIHTANEKTVAQIANEAHALIAAALAGKPSPGSESGLTFIVNNVGAPVSWRGMDFAGDEYPSPIPAPGTAAILAFGAVRQEWQGPPSHKATEGQGKRMALTIRFDHRVCDGSEPIRFLRALGYLIENPEQILLL